MHNARAIFAVPGDLSIRTGGYIYDRKVMDELRDRGIDVEHVELPASFPFPDAADIAETIEALNARSGHLPVIIDGLAWGAVPHEQARRVRAPVIALCHHPLGLEAGLQPAQAAFLIQNEKKNLELAAHVIVTSKTTARTLMDDFAVPANRISVAEPGVERRNRARGSGTDIVEVLSVGALVPRKGHDLLIEALARLSELPWRLRIAGSFTRAAEWTEQLQKRIAEHDLHRRISLLGELDDQTLAHIFDTSDLFVSSSHYEGYGMVLAEAMSCGLAIISTTGGAAADTVPDACAIKIPSGDVAALERALGNAIGDAGLRQQLADAAWQAGQSLPHWADAADIFATIIDKIGGSVRA